MLVLERLTFSQLYFLEQNGKTDEEKDPLLPRCGMNFF